MVDAQQAQVDLARINLGFTKVRSLWTATDLSPKPGRLPRDSWKAKSRRSILLGLYQLRFGLGELSLRLFKRRLQRLGVNFKQHLSFFYERALPVGLPDEIAANLGLNLRIHKPVHIGHPFSNDGDIFLNHRRHLNLDCRSGRGRVFTAALHISPLNCFALTLPAQTTFEECRTFLPGVVIK